MTGVLTLNPSCHVQLVAKMKYLENVTSLNHVACATKPIPPACGLLGSRLAMSSSRHLLRHICSYSSSKAAIYIFGSLRMYARATPLP
jgi:hypothetical protein